MAIVGSAYVEIHTITKSVADEVRAGLRDALNGQGTASGKQFGDEYSKQVKDTVARSTSETTRDTVKEYASAGDESGKQFSSRFSSIMDRFKTKVIKPPVDTTELEIKIARAKLRLEELGAKEVSPKVDLDIRQTEFELAKLNAKLAEATRDRTINVHVDNKSLNESIVGVAQLGRALSLLGLPGAILAASPYLVSLASSATQMAGAAGVMGAGLLGLIGVVGTSIIAFHGLGDALGPTGTKAQIEKVNEAMAKLPPNARDVVTTIRGLGDEWKSVSSVVQNNMFAGVGAQMAVLATAWIPMLRGQLGGMASELGQLANQTMAWLSSTEAVSGFGTILGNTTLSLDRMGTVGASALRIITAIGVVGSNFLPQLATTFANAADRAADFLEKAKESGKLAEWMQGGLDVVHQLYQLILNLGSILGSLFSAVNKSGESFLSIVVRISGSIAAALKSPEGQSGLAEFFTSVRFVVENFLHTLMEFGPVLVAAGRLFVALYPAIAPFSGAITQLVIAGMVPLLNVLTFLAPVLGPLIVLFTTLMTVAKILTAVQVASTAASAAFALAQGTITKATTEQTAAMASNKLATLAGTAASYIARGAVLAWTGAQWLLNAALSANPIGLIVIAIALLVAGIIYAYTHFESFRKIVTGAFDAVMSVVKTVVDFFTGPFVDAISGAFTTVVGWFTDLPGRILGFLSGLGSSIAGFASSAWDSLVTSLITVGEGIDNFFTNLPQKIAFALGFLAGTLVRLAVDGWNGFTNGLETAWNATYAFFVGLPDRIMTGLSNLGTFLWTTATNAWKSFHDGIVNAWNATWAWVTGLPDRFISALVSLAVSLYTSGTNAWKSFHDAVVSAADATWTWLQALPGRILSYFVSLAISMMTSGKNAWEGFQTGITNAWNATVAWFIGLPAAIGNFFSNAGTWLWQTGADIINGLVEGLKSAWNTVWTWVTGVVDSFIQGFKAGFGVASPSTIFMTIGTDILMGFLNGLISMVEMILGFITGFIDRVITGFGRLLTFWNSVWDAILAYAQAIWQAFVDFFTAAIEAFVTLFTTMFGGVRTFWESVWQAISDFGQRLWNIISSYFIAGFNLFSAAFNAVFSAVRAFWESIWNAIKAFGEALWNALVAFYDSGFTNWRGLFEAVMNAINAFWAMIWNAIRAFGEQIWNIIVAFFTAGFNLFRAMIESVMNAISAFWTSIWNAIRTLAETVWNAFSAFITAALNAFRALIESVMNAVSAVWTAIWNAIKATGESIWNGISSFFSGALNTFQSWWHGAWDTVSRAFSDVWNGIKSVASSIWGGIESTFKGGVNAVLNGVNWLVQQVNKVLGFLHIATIPGISLLATGGVLGMQQLAAGGRVGHGFVTKRPMAIVGEGNPNYPEYVIPTDPQHRDRASQLYQSLGTELHGAPMMASGGIIDWIGNAAGSVWNGVTAAASSIGSAIGDAVSWVGDGANALLGRALDAISGMIPAGTFRDAAISIVKSSWDGIKKMVNDAIAAQAAAAVGGGAGGPVIDVGGARGWIIAHESGGNPRAQNPTSSASGLYQFIDGTWKSLGGSTAHAKDASVAEQNMIADRYIAQRYQGSWAVAQAFWQSHGWYDKGGWLPPGTSTAFNGTGKHEAVIADPMTTFERSFKNVFRWLAPSVSGAITHSIDNLDEIVMRSGGEEKFERAFRKVYASYPRWAQDLVKQRFPEIVAAIKSPELDLVGAIQDTFTPPTPPVIPPPVVELPTEIPPVTVPDLPTGEIRASFEDAIARLAPELSLSIKAASASGIREFGTQVLGSDDRLAAIADAMGSPVADLKGILAKLVDSATEVIPQPAPIPVPPLPDFSWLEVQVQRLRDFALANANRASNAGDRVNRLPDNIEKAFESAFPDFVKATKTSVIDVNRVLATRANDILSYAEKLNPEDAISLLNALDGQRRTLDEFIRWQAQQQTPANAAASGATLTFHEGAFSVNINGNADSVTVDQLQTTLQDWGEEILHQYEGRT